MASGVTRAMSACRRMGKLKRNGKMKFTIRPMKGTTSTLKLEGRMFRV
jgi:hypothetical protein